MNIEENVVVSLAYKVKLEDGVVVDQATAQTPLEYLHGYNNLITGLEAELQGKKAGDSFSATLAPQDAYGEHNDALVQRVPAEVFQGVEQIEVGMRFLADTDQGQIPVEVTEVDGEEVVVDGNHMLAGQTLTFDVEVIATRAATTEEIEHGHINQDSSDHEQDSDDHEGGCCGGEGHQHEGKKEGCCGGGGGCGCSH